MIVKKDYEGKWDIFHNDKIVGHIEHHTSFVGRGGHKVLYVGEKRIVDVRNQQEALEKLEKFFADNKLKIKGIEICIDNLKEDKSKVAHSVSANALDKEISRLERELGVYKEYDLV